jgi:hypothetical protein
VLGEEANEVVKIKTTQKNKKSKKEKRKGRNKWSRKIEEETK